MQEVTIFENKQFGKIRTVIGENGEPLFCGKDVAEALGYERARDAISAHCKGAVKHGILTNGGVQEMSFITEGDLYRLVCSSKLPKAQEFEEWVFDEVLPSIRKTGSYTIPRVSQISKEELELRQAEVKKETAQLWHELAIEYKPKNSDYGQILDAYATKALEGKFVLPLPVVERETFSATEIGKQLGVSANTIGKIANSNNLKTDKFGKWFIDKSRYSNKEVETFRYFDSVIPEIKKYLEA